MYPTRMASILLALLSAILLTHPVKSATAEQSGPPTYKPEIKVFIPFIPNYDTRLKLVKPGQGLTFIETEESTPAPMDYSYPSTNLGYCENESSTSTTSSSDDPHSQSESDPSCQ